MRLLLPNRTVPALSVLRRRPVDCVIPGSPTVQRRKWKKAGPRLSPDLESRPAPASLLLPSFGRFSNTLCTGLIPRYGIRTRNERFAKGRRRTEPERSVRPHFHTSELHIAVV